MIRILLAIVLLVSVASLTYGRKVAEGNSNTPLGKYTIEALDEPLMLAGEEMKCYVITYENSPMKVKVFVDKDAKCKNYIVASDDLTVMYKCNGEYFGVNKVDKKYSQAGFRTDDKKLDRTDYFHQKLITPGKQPELEATQLIAAYFPMLLNNPTEAIASR